MKEKIKKLLSPSCQFSIYLTQKPLKQLLKLNHDKKSIKSFFETPKPSTSRQSDSDSCSDTTCSSDTDDDDCDDSDSADMKRMEVEEPEQVIVLD